MSLLRFVGRMWKWILVGLVLIVVFDNYVAKHANTVLLSRDYYFNDRVSGSNLNLSDVESGLREICHFDYIYRIYPYQTCFRRDTASSNQDHWGYDFIYSPPRPRLAIFFRGDDEEDYYFKYAEEPFAHRLKYINVNGDIGDFEQE